VREFVVTQQQLDAWLGVVVPLLDERQARLVAGATAVMLGRGGKTAVMEATSMGWHRVAAGAAAVAGGEAKPSERVRAPGAGRRRLIDVDPGLLLDLDELVEPESRGDPMCPLRWTSKSTYTLASELRGEGHQVSAETVRLLLHDMGYSLQAPAKENEGAWHPDRDAQFRYLHDQAIAHLAAGEPVISVDIKKKELVGNKTNKGREWQPSKTPVRVDIHDFPDPEVPKAIPYGVYDVAANQGWVSVGDDNDTAAFAVNTIRRWWSVVGSVAYPDATRLLITADAGGSNGYRNRLWKMELASPAADTGLQITACHYPPGTSKWNKIEHRLFSHISMNWRGRPLTSHQTIVNLIANTTTATGLKVRAELDHGYYPTGVKITNKQLADLPLTRHHWHGDWNYTLAAHPQPKTTNL